MFAKKTKKACAILMALAMVTSGALMGALADDYEVEIVGEEPAQSNTTQSQDGVVVVEQTQAQPGASGSTQSTQDSGTAGSSAIIDPANRRTFRVDFYDRLNTLLGGVDIQEGDYIIEPETKPYEPSGMTFLFWYDETEQFLTPYVFGTPVTKNLNLRPYYATLPQIADNSGSGSSQYVTMTPEQTTQVVQEIIAAGQVITELPKAPEQTIMTPEEVNVIVDEILHTENFKDEQPQGNEESPMPDNRPTVVNVDQTNEIISDILSTQNQTGGDTQQQTPATEAPAEEPAQQPQTIADIIPDVPTEVSTDAPVDVPAQIIEPNTDADVVIIATEEQVAATEEPTVGDRVTSAEQTASLIEEILSQAQYEMPTEQATAPEAIADIIPATEEATEGTVVTDQPSVIVEEQATEAATAEQEETSNIVMSDQQVNTLIADIIGEMVQSTTGTPSDTVAPIEVATDEVTIPTEESATEGATEMATEAATEQPSSVPDQSNILEELFPTTEESTVAETEATEAETEATEEDTAEETDEATEADVTEEATEADSAEVTDEATEEDSAEVTDEATEEGDTEVTDEATEESDTETSDEATEEGDTEATDEATEEGDTADTAEESDLTGETDEENTDETAETDEEGATDESGEETEELSGEDTAETGETEEDTAETEEETADTLETEEETAEETSEEATDDTEADTLEEGAENTSDETEEEFTDEEGEPLDISNISVSVDMRVRREGEPLPEDETITYGDTIVVRGYPDNADNVMYRLQWQRDTGDGRWRSIEGATGEEYTFILTEENLYWNYRLVMLIDLPDDAE